MLQLLETGKALYVLAVICGLGILTRLVTGRLYKRLLKESTNLAMTKNKSLKELRQRAENTYRMNQGLRDSGAWLEHQLFELRYMGITLAGWNALAMQWTWLCLLFGAAGAFASYWYRLDTFYIVLYGGGAVMLAMVMMLFDLGGAGSRKERLLSALQDYMENVMCPRLARNQAIDGSRELSDGSGRNRIFAPRRHASGAYGGFGRAERGMPVLDQPALESAAAEDDGSARADGEISGSGRGGAGVPGGTENALSPDSVVSGGRSGRKLSGRAARRAAAAARAETARAEMARSDRTRGEISRGGISRTGILRNDAARGGTDRADAELPEGAQPDMRRSGRSDPSPMEDAGERGIEKAESRSEAEYLKRSLEQIAASREKTRSADENWLKDLGPDEVQLIGDIIKQYLG